jgi:Spy/CpxP family protein refolding chaperone
MKKMISSTTLVLLVFLSVSTMTFARGGRGNGKGCQNNNNQPISYVEKLKLTDEQVSKITVLIQKDNGETKILQDKIRTNFTTLREMEWSKSFDQTIADKLRKEMSEAQGTMQTNHQKLNVDIRSLLTTDQQNLFISIGGCLNYGVCGGGCSRGQSNLSSSPINFVVKLTLTDDQINKIFPLIQKDNASTTTLQDKIHHNFTTLREMEWSKSYSQTTADKLLQEINDSKTTLRNNHQKLNQDITLLLTPAQQKIFAQLGGCLGLGLGTGTGCGRNGCPR